MLAAHRYGLKRVILPERNLKDLAEVPSAVLTSLEVNTIDKYFDFFIRYSLQSSMVLTFKA